MIIFVGGLIGAGKSTVARTLANNFGLYYYDVDEVKKTVFREDPDYDRNMKQGIPFRNSTREKVYEVVIENLKELSEEHKCIVVDEALHKKELRHRLFSAAEKYFNGFFVVWVKASEEVITQRLETNVRKNHILKDPMKMHKTMLNEFEGFEQCVLICRNNTSIEDTMIELRRFFSAIFRFGKLSSKV